MRWHRKQLCTHFVQSASYPLHQKVCWSLTNVRLTPLCPAIGLPWQWYRIALRISLGTHSWVTALLPIAGRFEKRSSSFAFRNRTWSRMKNCSWLFPLGCTGTPSVLVPFLHIDKSRSMSRRSVGSRRCASLMSSTTGRSGPLSTAEQIDSVGVRLPHSFGCSRLATLCQSCHVRPDLVAHVVGWVGGCVVVQSQHSFPHWTQSFFSQCASFSHCSQHDISRATSASAKTCLP